MNFENTPEISRECQVAVDICETNIDEAHQYEDGKDEMIDINSLYSDSDVNNSFSWRKLPKVVSWLSCVCIFAYFASTSILEFCANNPVSITTYPHLMKSEAWVSISICNSPPVDPQKMDVINEAILAMYPISNVYLMSSELYRKTTLDIWDFMVACEISGTSCLDSFKWNLESIGPCYKGDFNLFDTGVHNSLLLDFYFEPELSTLKQFPNRGVFISVSHRDDYVSPLNGIFIQPKQQTSVSVRFVHEMQKQSFPKAKCAHRYGLETHNFTGQPFQAEYHLESCIELCMAEEEYRMCNCSIIIGWNSTKTECLEDFSKNICVWEYNSDLVRYYKLLESCSSKCVPKCIRKRVEYETTNIFQNPTVLSYTAPASRSSLASKLEQKLRDSTNDSEARDRISDNYSRFALQLRNREKLKVIEIIPMMTTASFTGTFGGLLGMWLGYSALSILQLLQIMFGPLIKKIVAQFKKDVK